MSCTNLYWSFDALVCSAQPAVTPPHVAQQCEANAIILSTFQVSVLANTNMQNTDTFRS